MSETDEINQKFADDATAISALIKEASVARTERQLDKAAALHEKAKARTALLLDEIALNISNNNPRIDMEQARIFATEQAADLLRAATSAPIDKSKPRQTER